MMNINVLKCHGSGNDFIIIDEMNGNYNFSEDDRIILSKYLTKRGRSIGSDGILFIQDSDRADAKMRMFNTDGSEAEMCGNGLRCVARYVIDLLNNEHIVIETMKADLEVEKVDDIFEDVLTYEVAIEPVFLHPKTLPLNVDQPQHVDTVIKGLDDSLSFTALSVPNPHIVAVVDEVYQKQVREIGQRANEKKDIFPNGVNVSFLKDLGDAKVFVQTFERGVGLTNACGTAMSASSLVSCLLGINKFHEVITVLNPGGMVQCVVNKDDEKGYTVRLRGNATFEFEGTVDFDFSEPEKAELVEQHVFEDEIALYDKLAQQAKNMA
ncbi:diaminopimelate epimerase [Salipaludibacillus neizhouensis]|nr:diaminopimelate epimerase [Salipaludibacillus neizhouensis]